MRMMRINTNRSLKHAVIISILALGLTAQACETSGPKGVWKSIDGGQTWGRVNLVTVSGKRPSAILDNLDIRQITGAPDLENLLYASTPVGAFATDNGAEVWHQVLPGINVQEVATARSDPATVYAVGSIQNRGVVYKTVNRGKDWERKYIESAENVAF